MKISNQNIDLFKNLVTFEIGEHERIEIELFESEVNGLDIYYELGPGDLYAENEKFIFIKSPYKCSHTLKVMINKDAIRKICFRDFKAEAMLKKELELTEEEFLKL